MAGDRAQEGQQQTTLDTPETAKADVRIAYLEWIGYITTAAHSTECSRLRIVESKDQMGQSGVVGMRNFWNLCLMACCCIGSSGCSRMSSCSPEEWSRTGFDFDKWRAGVARYEFYNDIRNSFVGLEYVDVESKVGRQDRVSSDGVWIYRLSELSFMECGFYSHAFMVVQFNDGKAASIGYYMD